MTLPCALPWADHAQVLRGDTLINASQRLDAFVDAVPRPSCCGLVAGGRAVLPYENAKDVAERLVDFLAKEYDGTLSRR